MSPRDDDYTSDEGGGGPAPLLDPVGLLERRWKPMAAGLVLGVLASVGFSFRAEPRYEAEATVLVAPQQISERIVEPTIQEDALTRIDALAAEVLSRSNLARLVEEFDVYPELRNQETMGEVVSRMRADVTIKAVETTSGGDRGMTARAYAIRFEASKPEVAAEVANALATLFVDTSFEERHRQHQLTSDFLRRELARAEQELREQNRLIADFKEQNRALLPSDLQANLTRLDMLQNQRQSLSLQIAEAGTRIASLASDDHSSPEAKLAALHQELERLRSIQTERHPDVVELKRRIEQLERDPASSGPGQDESPRGLLQAADRTLGVLRGQLAATEHELSALDAKIGKMPAVQEDLASLEEKASILRENYLDFLRKVQDAELDENLLKAQQGERVSVLNPAEPPSQPMHGQWQYLGFGLFASLGLALVVGIALEFADPVVISAEQVAAALRPADARLGGAHPLGVGGERSADRPADLRGELEQLLLGVPPRLHGRRQAHEGELGVARERVADARDLLPALAARPTPRRLEPVESLALVRALVRGQQLAREPPALRQRDLHRARGHHLPARSGVAEGRVVSALAVRRRAPVEGHVDRDRRPLGRLELPREVAVRLEHRALLRRERPFLGERPGTHGAREAREAGQRLRASAETRPGAERERGKEEAHRHRNQTRPLRHRSHLASATRSAVPTA